MGPKFATSCICLLGYMLTLARLTSDSRPGLDRLCMVMPAYAYSSIEALLELHGMSATVTDVTCDPAE